MEREHKQWYTGLIVGVALGRVEVECENESGPFEDDDLVVLVGAGHVGRVGGQPPELLFSADGKNQIILNSVHYGAQTSSR